MEQKKTINLLKPVTVMVGLIPENDPGAIMDMLKNIMLRVIEEGTEVTIEVTNIVRVFEHPAVNVKLQVTGESEFQTWGTTETQFEEVTGFPLNEMVLPEIIDIDLNKIITSSDLPEILPPPPPFGILAVVLMSIASASVGFAIAISGGF